MPSHDLTEWVGQPSHEGHIARGMKQVVGDASHQIDQEHLAAE